MSDTRKTIADLTARGTFDGTEQMEVFPTSVGVSRKVDVGIVIGFPSDTAWTTSTTLLNGWTGTIRYIRRAGMVTVLIEAAEGAAKTADTLFELPAAWRPGVVQRGVAVETTGGASGPFSISVAGGLIVSTITANIRGSITYPVIT